MNGSYMTNQDASVELREVKELIEKLTEKQKETLIRIILGDSIKTIANSLGVPETTIKSRVRGARRTLLKAVN